MSEPKRYHLVTDKFLESDMRPSDDCLKHDEIAEEQEYVRYEDYARLKEEVERLTKAGDWLVEAVQTDDCWENWDKGIAKWNAAKEGKQP